MGDPAFALRDELRARREVLIAAFLAGGGVEALLKGLAHATDELLRRMVGESGLDPATAILAVGGYGRGELFPHSDVDVLILLPEAPELDERERIEALVGRLWDLGLHIGHSVRTVAECREEAARDITVQTSMIEARLVAGPRPLFARFRRAVAATMDARAFFRAKMLEQQQRHTKYHETPYSLEPNIKESPGGLRDLHVVMWVARAAGLGSSWGEMARNGLITLDEARNLRRVERRLKDIRARVHLVANRREDRLVFDVQQAVAASAHIEPTGSRRAGEVLMQRYYLAAKAITQLNTILLLNIEQRLFERGRGEPVPLDETFVARDERLDLAADDGLERDPNGILRGFLLLEQHPELKGMSTRLLRALWHAREGMDGAFRREPRNRATFLAILQQRKGVLHALRAMNQWGILGRYLPVFRRIVGQMQHDLFHVYTVDQHILQVVRNLRRFMLSEYAHEYPLCSQLIADFDSPWLLIVAALFHDIAKGRGGDHSTLGARDVRRFCRDHGLGADDTELVAFLVEHHLTMSTVAQKQDLADPAVIERFAATVGSERRLTALYLLTVADIRGTSPKVWNAWKGKLLEDLFRLTRRRLGGEPASPTALLESRKQEALHVLRLYGLQDSARDELWAQLDVVYFLRHSAQDIAWHTRSLFSRVNAEQPIVRARLARIGEGAEVLIYARDRKDLFARVAGYFESRNLSILDARIHTTRHGYALDTFLVTDHGQHPHYRELLSQIEHELAAAIASDAPLVAPARGRMSRKSRHFPVTPAVALQPDERGRSYLLSVTATDRIGLLSSIARVLAAHQINVQTAKILTLGERVEDVFLVDGAALAEAKRQIEVETELLAAIAS